MVIRIMGMTCMYGESRLTEYTPSYTYTHVIVCRLQTFAYIYTQVHPFIFFMFLSDMIILAYVITLFSNTHLNIDVKNAHTYFKAMPHISSNIYLHHVTQTTHHTIHNTTHTNIHAIHTHKHTHT